jgi:hypothetical protein
VGRNLYDRGLPSVNAFFATRGSSVAAPTNATIIYNDPNRKDARFQQYNLTFQYGFWKNWLAEAAYVGSTGDNLLIVQNIGNGNDAGAPIWANLITTLCRRNSKDASATAFRFFRRTLSPKRSTTRPAAFV